MDVAFAVPHGEERRVGPVGLFAPTIEVPISMRRTVGEPDHLLSCDDSRVNVSSAKSRVKVQMGKTTNFMCAFVCSRRSRYASCCQEFTASQAEVRPRTQKVGEVQSDAWMRNSMRHMFATSMMKTIARTTPMGMLTTMMMARKRMTTRSTRSKKGRRNTRDIIMC